MWIKFFKYKILEEWEVSQRQPVSLSISLSIGELVLKKKKSADLYQLSIILINPNVYFINFNRRIPLERTDMKMKYW